ncbi:MAG: bifunctional demethylmenaquinone methyltransferase/2-methoxy-6-polyprenyl-1,4-benzoquinol methylase UbiE [Zetaproteobacteria bacterium]|nr:MAG: bifunctional demethylmenaquinone methyltransferase/2-methoxy-6-polyprenyl-1,4-benzoquinol methylase UbiE [Zetaproteobacteria bacterium]
MTGQTHFGFRQVAPEEKRRRVMALFSSVAERYDLMNDLMSLGLHRWWKRCMVASAAVRRGGRVLDVAAGSGDIALALADRVGPEGRVVLLDPNRPMLAEGAARLIDAGLLPGRADCIQGDGAALPFADRSFDQVTIAFGLRNFVDPERGLAEFQRVLRPGGQLLVLEFSRPVLPLLEPLYDAWSFHLIPLLGEKVAGDRAAYQYLVESIRRFPDQRRLCRWMEQAGFALVRYRNLSGGIVAIHRGYRL